MPAVSMDRSLQPVAKEIAATVLEKVGEIEIWEGLCTSKDEKIRLDAMKYLTDRARGKATQPVAGDDTMPPIAVAMLMDAGSDEED